MYFIRYHFHQYYLGFHDCKANTALKVVSVSHISVSFFNKYKKVSFLHQMTRYWKSKLAFHYSKLFFQQNCGTWKMFYNFQSLFDFEHFWLCKF